MLGGNQFKNNLGNQIIIKCHECGDTNLRYVGVARTDGHPSGYVCGNGHETWGGVDEFIDNDRWGQTDVEQTRVNDCCCESLGCDLPKSIKVNFNGLIGVQARESCGLQIPEDISTRVYMPYSHCGPCCDVTYDSSTNSAWSVDCGCDIVTGPCHTSDNTANANPVCVSDSRVVYSGCLLTSGIYTIETDNVSFYSDVPADRISTTETWGDSPFTGTWIGRGAACTDHGDCGTCPEPTITPGFFAGGYPYNYAAPFFIREIPGVLGNTWQNDGHSIRFVVREQTYLKYNDPCDHTKGCCRAWKRSYYIARRDHPTTDPTGNSGFTWTISDEGIGTKVVEWSCDDQDQSGGCAATWESPNIDLNALAQTLCDLSNTNFACTNCNNSVGEITYNICENEGARRFWPFRVPYFHSTSLNGYQLVRENAGDYPTYGECNCAGADYAISPCPENLQPGDPFVPDFCTRSITYPTCLQQGTDFCRDVDARYRVACANPTASFTGSLIGEGNKDLLNYRYSISLQGLNGAAQGGDIDSVRVNFSPISEGYRSSTYDSGGETWSYPLSPNALCVNAHRIGYVLQFGDPSPITPANNAFWNNPGHPLYPDGGAVGISRATIGQIFENSKTIVEQPHCLRRVRNPNLASTWPFYQVNTADVSEQTMILDRFYKTSNDFDWLWKDYLLAEPDVAEQAFINRQGDRGVVDFLNSQLFPYSMISRSGSVEEPEIVAIIHSESGVGGQVAFQTIPVSYDTDELIDPTDGLVPEKGFCPYKTRVTAYGYGVMYPLIDDPIWSEEIDTTDWWDIPYDPNNPIFDTTTIRRSAFEYPVFIPGTGYAIGDKIEFRCWKCLDDAAERGANPGEHESIWEEECVESIIATATITELNDERKPPKKVEQSISQGKITVAIDVSGTDRYYETYKLGGAVATGGLGYASGDTIDIRFEDTDGYDGIVHYEAFPSLEVTEVDDDGAIINTEILESGSFYKIIRTGGIRWYEFDEQDENGDLLISVGNCPCSFDICGPLCNGCVSKSMYPTGVYDHQILEAAPNGFPGVPYPQCVTVPGVEDNSDPPEPIILWCPSSESSVDCGTNCTYTSRWASSLSLGWMRLNDGDCPGNCSCDGAPSEFPATWGQTSSADCRCTKSSSGPMYISGWTTNSAYPDLCWPLNSSYEFYTENYAVSACSGTPVTPGFRAYMDGYTVIPHKKPQHKYVWLPNTSGFIGSLSQYVDSDTADDQQALNTIIDSFLGIDACNPGKYDRFNKSYRWLTRENTGKAPCRKKLNNSDTIPSGVTRTIDDYCRSYGFYQQRQPTCQVFYRGQYIMRAAVKLASLDGDTYGDGDCEVDPGALLPNGSHVGTDCDPIIEDIAIYLNKFEAQFDISVGAPYNQDYLIPEQLPIPATGADGFLESRADSWNYPSLTGLDNTRFFDHGFYEPNRYSEFIEMEMPENQEGLAVGDEPVLTPVFTVNPLFHIYDVDGGGHLQDFRGGVDFANINIWDWPDPRDNCSGVNGGTCHEYDVPLGVLYPSGNVPLPSSLLQNKFILEHLYPWENYRATDDVDHYAMFKNNSAELALGEIEECLNCRGSILIYDKSGNEDALTGVTSVPDRYWGGSFNYTDRRVFSQVFDPDTGSLESEEAIIFRAFGMENNSFTVQAFKDVIDDYIQVWTDVFDPYAINILGALQQDIFRSILWNMLFEGAANQALAGLTKVEVIYHAKTITEPTNSYDPAGTAHTVYRLYTEDRCEYYEKTGSVKSVEVINGGAGYAFEIEERVAPSGIVQSIPKVEISGSTTVQERYRRRETYTLDQIELIGSGIGHTLNEVINIRFNDADARRDGVVYTQQPSIRITGVDEDGHITGYEIANSGEFYKYIGTGQHRAFPTAIVLNNYWDYPNGSQNFGRHAKLVPVIGVDPQDPGSYGKIKRVDVTFGGIEYKQPGQYWGITTTMGDYDDYGNLITGLDIQHLVDPCKFRIHGDGFTSEQLQESDAWLGGANNGPDSEVYFPERQALYIPSANETQQATVGNPFTHSVKHYLNTNSSMTPTKWANKVKGWDTVLVSGSCPVDASGGLLNRTYSMALVEEASMYYNRTHQGFCSDALCDQLIDYNDPSCTDPNAVIPGEYRVKTCGDPCPVFTVYDAHRYNIAGTNNLMHDINAQPTPYLVGCSERIPITDPAVASLFCYDFYQQPENGGSAQTQGFTTWNMIGSSKDWCKSAEYSLYAEFGKWHDGGTQNDVRQMRIKSITYAMKDPITMTVAYNDDTVPVEYSGCSDLHLSGICEPCPSPTPTPTASSLP